MLSSFAFCPSGQLIGCPVTGGEQHWVPEDFIQLCLPISTPLWIDIIKANRLPALFWMLLGSFCYAAIRWMQGLNGKTSPAPISLQRVAVFLVIYLENSIYSHLVGCLWVHTFKGHTCVSFIWSEDVQINFSISKRPYYAFCCLLVPVVWIIGFGAF